MTSRGSLTPKAPNDMVITRIRPLTIGSNPNELLRNRVRVLNGQARRTAREIQTQCKNDRCDEHEDQDSLITVVPHWDGRFTFEKTDFCCAAYSRRYTFEEPDWIDVLEESAQDEAKISQLCLWSEGAENATGSFR